MVVLLDADGEAVERAALARGEGVAFPGPSLGLLDELELIYLIKWIILVIKIYKELLTFTTQFKSGLTCSDLCRVGRRI